jgi:Putative beta barrel porin-7 (BBP7)
MKFAAAAIMLAFLALPPLCHSQEPDNTLPVKPAPMPNSPPSTSKELFEGFGFQPIAEPWSGVNCEVVTPGNDWLQLRASYLLWWLDRDNAHLPVLTTGGAGGGALGQPDTVVLLRAGDVGPTQPFSGGDFGAHVWIDPEQMFGLDGRFFYLPKQSASFSAAGNAAGSPLLSIPFNDLNPILPGASYTQIANPGASTGQVRFDSSTQLWGAELSADLRSWSWGRLTVSTLFGFRYMDLQETYGIDQNVVSVGQVPLLVFRGVPIPGNNSLQISDAFNTHNQFYGGNLILRADYQILPTLTLDVTSRTAIGGTYNELNIAGSTTQLGPQGNVVAVSNGGLFAQPYNSGRHSEYSFSVVPELEVCLVWDVTQHLQLTAGYNFLYWSNVLRPASQIPGTINTTTAPSQATFGGGGPIPVEAFHLTSLTAQGITVGLVLRF